MNQVLWNASRPKITRAGTSTRAGSSRPVRQAMESSSRGWSGWRVEVGAAGMAEEPEVATAEVGLVVGGRRPPGAGPPGAGRAGRSIVVGLPHAGRPPSPTKSKSLCAGSKAPGRARLPIETVAADRQHVAVGRLEGDLREPGGGEIGPDGGRGVGRAAVPGPDHLRPHPAEARQRLDGARDVARLMFPNTPQTSTRSAGTSLSYHRHSEASPSTIRTCSATPAAAARSRAKATRAGSSSTSSAETSRPRGWVDDDVDHVTALAGAQAHHPDGSWMGGGAPDRGSRAPWTGRSGGAATAATRGPRRAGASAPSASPTVRADAAEPPRRPPPLLDGPRGP